MENMSRILMPKEVFDQMTGHCRSVYPNEACGILGGKNSVVKKIYEMTNVDHSPVSYIMDTKEQFNVMKDMRKDGYDMVAIYHSHPHSPAYPSPKDREFAYYSTAVYVIVSLVDQEKPDVRAFEIDEVELKEVEIYF